MNSRLLKLLIAGLGVCYWLEYVNWFIIIASAAIMLGIAYRISSIDVENSNEGKSTVGGFIIPIVLVIATVILVSWYSLSHYKRSPYGGVKRHYYNTNPY